MAFLPSWSSRHRVTPTTYDILMPKFGDAAAPAGIIKKERRSPADTDLLCLKLLRQGLPRSDIAALLGVGNRRVVDGIARARKQLTDWVNEDRSHSTRMEERRVRGLLDAPRNKRWYEKNRESVMCRKYGITLNDLAAMIKESGNKCQICRTPFSNIVGNRRCIDHCHKTNKVRGLLCGPCNKLLGDAKDNPAILQAAAQYLKRSSAQ